MNIENHITKSISETERTARADKLGVDIGRVIIQGDGPDTNFIGGSEDEAMRAPAMEGVVEALALLVEQFRPENVWIVSKCGPRIEARSRAWLDRRRFFESTGIPRANIRFCKQRRDKAKICLDLGIGYFVDDRVDVLVPMAGIVPHRFLFGATSSREPGIVAVPTWAAAEAAISRLLDEGVSPARGTPAAHAP